jgi:ribosomal protein S18 acetylase RimI-like enzyme
MLLAPFDLTHADLVASWATTSADLDRWASLKSAPTPETFARWLDEPDVRARLLVEDQPLGYGELWLSEDEDEIELARLLVAPERRGSGLGQTLVDLLVEESRRLPISTAWVRVVPDNSAALRCYLAAGFSLASPQVEAEFNAPQPRPYRWLSLVL